MFKPLTSVQSFEKSSTGGGPTNLKTLEFDF